MIIGHCVPFARRVGAQLRKVFGFPKGVYFRKCGLAWRQQRWIAVIVDEESKCIFTALEISESFLFALNRFFHDPRAAPIATKFVYTTESIW